MFQSYVPIYTEFAGVFFGGGQEILIITYFNGVVRICNKCDEKAENHICKKTNEGI